MRTFALHTVLYIFAELLRICESFVRNPELDRFQPSISRTCANKERSYTI